MIVRSPESWIAMAHYSDVKYSLANNVQPSRAKSARTQMLADSTHGHHSPTRLDTDPMGSNGNTPYNLAVPALSHARLARAKNSHLAAPDQTQTHVFARTQKNRATPYKSFE